MLRGGSASVAGDIVGAHAVVPPNLRVQLVKPNPCAIRWKMSLDTNNLSFGKKNLSFEKKKKTRQDGSGQTVGSRVSSTQRLSAGARGDTRFALHTYSVVAAM